MVAIICAHISFKGKNTKLKSIKLAIFKAVSIAVMVITEVWY